MDSSQPLPIRDSTGSVRGYSHFSQYLKAQQGGYVDCVEAEDHNTGPIEQYDKRKEGEWILEKRVSQGPKGDPGMLFRDQFGGWHFIADV